MLFLIALELTKRKKKPQILPFLNQLKISSLKFWEKKENKKYFTEEISQEYEVCLSHF